MREMMNPTTRAFKRPSNKSTAFRCAPSTGTICNSWYVFWMVHARWVLLLFGISPIINKQKVNHLPLNDSISFEGKRDKTTKRCHEKSHGLTSFQEIACIVADGYRSIDDKTIEYVTTVATILDVPRIYWYNMQVSIYLLNGTCQVSVIIIWDLSHYW